MYQPEDAMEIPAELAFIFSKMDGVFLRKMFILLLLSVISDIYMTAALGTIWKVGSYRRQNIFLISYVCFRRTFS